LLLRFLANLLNIFSELVQLQIQNNLQSQFIVGLQLILLGEFAGLGNLFPIMRFLNEGVSGQQFDEPQFLPEFLNVLLHLPDYVTGVVVVERVKLFAQFHRFLQKFLIHEFLQLREIVLE
jgi:hypothetical protein